MPINVTRSSMPDFEEYCDEIKDLWDSHWLTNMGAKHKKFQKQLEEFFDIPYVTLFTNGHLALEAAISAFDFPAGSEIITTPFTFVSTTHAIVRCGYIPVFCDVKMDDYTLDPNKIEELITDKTVAILPVHVYGKLCDVEAIDQIAKKHNLKVIYDAAHAFGATYNGRSAAHFGDLAMFSFHATKVFNSIEGGAICYKDVKYQNKLKGFKNFGMLESDECSMIGGNAKMTEFQAAMGICNLRHLDREIGKRKAVVDEYNRYLQGVDGISIHSIQPNVSSNYAYYPVIFDGFKKNRNEIYELLKKHDIIARKYFYPITCDLDCYKMYSPKNTTYDVPISRYLAEHVLTLPLYADLPVEAVGTICRFILE